MNLSTLLEKRSAEFAEKEFMFFEQQPFTGKTDTSDTFKQTLSYRQFNNLVNRASHFLNSLGLKRGDVYNLHLPNCPTFLILWFAGVRLGAVMMPTNVLASREEMLYLLGHSKTRISFSVQAQMETIGQCRDALSCLDHVVCCDPYTATPEPGSFEAKFRLFSEQPYAGTAKQEDLAAIMYTSGTTSKPKGVMVTHANYIKAGQSVADAIELTGNDRQFVVLPLFHGNAQYYSTMSALITGASIVLMDRFSASQFFDKCTEYGCTVASLFAAPMRMILAQPRRDRHKYNKLRIVLFAQNITTEQIDDWHRRFNAPLCQLWGMTETMGPPLMNPLNGERRNWTVGKPIGGYQVRLVDADDNPVRAGQEGEIVVKGVPGRTIMSGYFENVTATRETIRNNWLHTGDNAVQDDAGFFRFVDRAKDMIKRSGENVSTAEVELILLQHPAVYECAIIGLPDEIRDERIVGVVVLKTNESVSGEDLIKFCAGQMAKFKVPERIFFEVDLPKTSVGKIQKSLIRLALLQK